MKIDKSTLLMWSQFKEYLFCEVPHTYYWNGKKVKWSVTQLVSKFCEPFNEQEISLRYAQKHNLDQEEVLAEWDKNRKIASFTGTILHKYAEDRQIGRICQDDFRDAIKENIYNEVKERVIQLCSMYDTFANDIFGKLIPLKMEYTVGIDDVIAGNIDLVCWNERYQEFNLIDYKTNKKIEKSNSYGKKMQGAMSKYDDCEFYKYSLQLALYKEMLCRKGINIGKCFIVWFNENNDKYQMFECVNLEKEARDILNALCKRECINMQKSV